MDSSVSVREHIARRLARARMQGSPNMVSSEAPVVKLGPGGDFVTVYRVAEEEGRSPWLVAELESAAAAWLERVATRLGRLALSEQLLTAHGAVVAGSCQLIAGLSRVLRGGSAWCLSEGAPTVGGGYGLVSESGLNSVEHRHESHSQATSDPSAHPRLAGAARLF